MRNSKCELRETTLCEHLHWIAKIRKTFVTLGGEASYMARRHPRAPKLMVSLKTFKNVRFTLARKEANIVNREKRLKKTWFGVDFCEQLKLLQWRRSQLGSNLLNFDKQIIVFILSFVFLSSCLIPYTP
jgi:hypothetical protein